MNYKIEICVKLKNDVLDPQGKAIQKAAYSMGLKNISEINQGKFFEIVISNANNKSSSTEILNLVKKSFANYNYNIDINYPFKGGFITSYYGKPKHNIHFLQIEVNKNIYMNEKSMSLKKNSFAELKVCFDNLIKDILFYLNYKE
mgnify:CR=1 FL=1